MMTEDRKGHIIHAEDLHVLFGDEAPEALAKALQTACARNNVAVVIALVEDGPTNKVDPPNRQGHYFIVNGGHYVSMAELLKSLSLKMHQCLHSECTRSYEMEPLRSPEEEE